MLPILIQQSPSAVAQPSLRPVVKRKAGRRAADRIDPNRAYLKLFIISHLFVFALGYLAGVGR